jgi:hypothetical protein
VVGFAFEPAVLIECDASLGMGCAHPALALLDHMPRLMG